MIRTLAVAGLLTFAASAQTAPPAAPLTFEVASVKPAAPLNPAMIMAGKMKIGLNVSGSRVDIGFLSLANLICLAYNVKDYQLSGPDWMQSQRFDIVAKMPDGANKDQVPEMLQALLVERFHLKTHKGSKENSMYALVVAKGGPKLKEAAPVTPPEPGAAPAPISIKQTGDGKGTVSAAGPNGPMKMNIGEGGAMHMQMNMTTANLAVFLTRFAGRPVVDETQLKGTYEMSLDMPADSLRAIAQSAGIAIPGAPGGGGAVGGALPLDSASDPSGSTIFATVQQMGLKLEPQKKPVELIVVDSVEKAPIEN